MQSTGASITLSALKSAVRNGRTKDAYFQRRDEIEIVKSIKLSEMQSIKKNLWF